MAMVFYGIKFDVHIVKAFFSIFMANTKTLKLALKKYIMYSQTLAETIPMSSQFPPQLNPYLMYHFSDLGYLKSYCLDLDLKIALQKNQIQFENNPLPKGRGGNNISQNTKKSILSILKKTLPKEVYAHFEEQCIQKHKLRSQKQNIIIFYLYLHKFYSLSIIEYSHISNATALLKNKINRYIENSALKMQIQGRKEFHLKNIEEFRKIMRLNLDFTQKRAFSEVIEQIKPFYLRKVKQFHKAVKRLQNIIQNDPYFESLFHDLSPSTNLVKLEQQSQ